jgi:hypothetical protein
MSVSSELSALREWLREDETRLQSSLLEPQQSEDPASEKRGRTVFDFNQFGNKEWGSGPGGWPWGQFNN